MTTSEIHVTTQKVHELPARERAAYLIHHVQQTGQLWGLMGKEGWIMVELATQTCLPVWPDESSVLSWQRQDMPDCQPKAIALDEFKVTWLPGLKKNNIGLVLFPSGTLREGIVTDADELVEHLRDEE